MTLPNRRPALVRFVAIPPDLTRSITSFTGSPGGCTRGPTSMRHRQTAADPKGVPMPRTLTGEECQAFLAEPHVGVLSVAGANGRPPLTVPIWYAYQPGGQITFFTGTGGHRARKTPLIQRAGVVSFLVQREEFPYRYVAVGATVAQSDQPPAAEQMLAILPRYLPAEHAQAFVDAELAHPTGTLRLFTVRPDRWLSADFG